MARLSLQPGDEITTGILYRRIPPIPGFVTTDPDGRVRPSSHNFSPDTGEEYLSVELRDDDDHERHMDAMLAHPDAKPGSGILEIDVAAFRAQGLTVKYEPDEGDRHFGVYGWETFPGPKAEVRARRKISHAATIPRLPK